MGNLRHSFFLAVRYLRSSPGRSVVLILGVAVALFLPIFTALAAQAIEAELMARAWESPILIGHKGNEFDLTMSSLYFRGQVRDPVTLATAREIEDDELGQALPLYVRYSVGGAPLVGTRLEYLDAREMELAEGRRFAVLGEVVAGAAVAEAFNLEAGDQVRSDLTNLYNLAGSYPLILNVVGILEPTEGPDDQAFFCDLRTTWALDGALHGHEEVSRDNAINPDAEEGESLEASAALFMFTEITPESLATFHMHGTEDEAPLSALLVLPSSQRAHDRILGRFALSETLQALEPTTVVETILSIVLRVQAALSLYLALVATSTVAFFSLVLALSLRLRRAELRLMTRMGCSRGTIFSMVAAEVGLVVVSASAVAVGLSWAGHSLLLAVLAAGGRG